MNLKLLARLKTRDAALVYAFLFEGLNRAAGTVGETSYERIAADLTNAGYMTARGAAFTARVVRSKLDELEEVDVVQRSPVTASTFELFVFMPYPCAAPPSELEPKVDHYGGKTLFDYASQNGNENGNGNGNENGNVEKTDVAINRNININKKINKERVEVDFSENEPQEQADAADVSEPTTDEIRERVDFSAEKVQRLRAEIARRAWEPTTNPDLIDRLAGAVVLKLINYREIFSMIDDAKEAVRRYERTDGRAGRSKIWESLAYNVKRLFETNGWKWTATKIGREPRPVDRAAERHAALLARIEAGEA